MPSHFLTEFLKNFIKFPYNSNTTKRKNKYNVLQNNKFKFLKNIKFKKKIDFIAFEII